MTYNVRAAVHTRAQVWVLLACLRDGCSWAAGHVTSGRSFFVAVLAGAAEVAHPPALCRSSSDSLLDTSSASLAMPPRVPEKVEPVKSEFSHLPFVPATSQSGQSLPTPATHPVDGISKTPSPKTMKPVTSAVSSHTPPTPTPLEGVPLAFPVGDQAALYHVAPPMPSADSVQTAHRLQVQHLQQLHQQQHAALQYSQQLQMYGQWPGHYPAVPVVLMSGMPPMMPMAANVPGGVYYPTMGAPMFMPPTYSPLAHAPVSMPPLVRVAEIPPVWPPIPSGPIVMPGSGDAVSGATERMAAQIVAQLHQADKLVSSASPTVVTALKKASPAKIAPYPPRKQASGATPNPDSDHSTPEVCRPRATFFSLIFSNADSIRLSFRAMTVLIANAARVHDVYVSLSGAFGRVALTWYLRLLICP